MNPLEWFHFFREILQWDAERLAAFFTGCGATLVLSILLFLLTRRFFRRRSREQILQKTVELTRDKADLQNRVKCLEGDIQVLKLESKNCEIHLRDSRLTCERLETQCRQVAANCESLSDQNRKLEEENQQLKYKNTEKLRAGKALLVERGLLRDQVDEMSQSCEDLKKEILLLDSSRQDLKNQVQVFEQEIQKVAALEGKIWEKPIDQPIPPFRPLLERKVPIVAVTNFKGGLGKTTLTANLGATLWADGKRVLLVDLDYQGSLTSLCLPDWQISDLRRGERLVHRLFQTVPARQLDDCLTRIEESSGFLVPTTDKLQDVETDAQTCWLMDSKYPDIRFLLREVLHAPQVQEEFDIILLDCPPRLTTASVNALTCCDYVLIPTLLDVTSAEAVPRCLEWLKVLKVKQVCPQLAVLGIVANRARIREGRLVARERDVWQELPDKCQDVWGEKVYHFKEIIPEDGTFAESAAAHKFAANTPKLNSVFRDLAQEVRRRINAHESNRVAVLR